MLDAIGEVALVVLRWTAGLAICAFMIFRAQQFIRIVLYGGLAIAVTAGVGIAAVPLLTVSPLLIPVAIILVAIIPIWVVFN